MEYPWFKKLTGGKKKTYGSSYELCFVIMFKDYWYG
jgi:hypothetical protein